MPDSIMKKLAKSVQDHTMPNIITVSTSTEATKGDQSKTVAKKFTMIVDEEPGIGGFNEGPNPIEYLMAALAGCRIVHYRLLAEDMGIKINSITIDAESDVDIRGTLLMDDSVRAGAQQIRLKINVDSDADEAQAKKLDELAEKTCVVGDNIRNETDLKVTISHDKA